MSEADERQKRIRTKVAASQARMQRDDASLPAATQRPNLPDRYPPEDYRSLAGEYPWLAVATGLGAGLLVGALLPKGPGGKFGQRAVAAASLAAELGLALSRRAGDAAGQSGREGLRRMDEATAPLRQRAARRGQSARGTGLTLAREAVRLAVRLRKG